MADIDYEQILDQMVLVALDVRIWSGRAKLRAEDIRLGQGGELPPREAASLGSKKVFDPQYLRPFERVKKKGERLLYEHGPALMGSWAVPADKLDGLATKLDQLKAEFAGYASDCLTHYEQRFEDWVGQFDHDPAFQKQLRKAKVPVEQLPGRFHFRYAVVRIRPADQPGDLQEQVEGLGDELLADVASEAADLYQRAFAGFGGDDRDYNQRTLRPLKRIREKVNGLLFLDPAARPLVQAIDEVLGRLPVRGKLSPSQLVEVVSLTQLLSERDRIRQLIEHYGELVTPTERDAAQWGTSVQPTGVMPATTIAGVPSSAVGEGSPCPALVESDNDAARGEPEPATEAEVATGGGPAIADHWF